MIKCNNCMIIFEDEDELIIIKENEEYFKACPHCLTDENLIDIEE